MTIHIENPAAEQALRDLIAATGESQATAVEVAARERLARLRKANRRERILRDVAELQRLSGDESLQTEDLYDEAGLPQ